MTRLLRVSTLVLVTAAMFVADALPVRAQTSDAVASAETLFADAAAKEAAVRKALVTDEPLPTLLKAVRTVVADYENVVRRYPTSGFSDDALWRAGKLARDAFDEFQEARERSTALRLLQLLQSGYPSSKLVKAVPEQLAWLNAHPATASAAASAQTAPVAAPAPDTVQGPLAARRADAVPQASSSKVADAPASASAPTATAARLVNIKAIRRAVLKDVVRIVIELDSEVPFHDERIENPTRIFVDLPSTRANPSLIDQTLRFDGDSDIVRQVRVGRHPNSTTRVVLEAAGVSSYSVYPLYSPFRLVIDCLRDGQQVASATPGRPATVPGNAPQVAAVPPSLPAHTTVAPPSAPTSPAPAARASRAPAPPKPEPVRPAVLDKPVPPGDVKPASTERATSESSGATRSFTPPDRPAWAVTLAKPPAVLAARRVRWMATMPPGTVITLQAPADLQVPATKAPTTAAKTPAAPTTPNGEAPRNVNGGISIARQLGLGISRIVIDPGHGGHDPGAKGADTTEAELVLDVALRLEKLLNKLPGVEVVLTRRENEFVPLQERTAIANREGADLFLSIHANASNVPAARGVETYFLNFASNQNAAAVAARENATSEQTMGSLQDMVKVIALNSKRDESRDFATIVQREMLDSLRDANKTVKDLGVKQAPFVVLVGASMPSVLSEISFITNPQEARLLKGSGYRQRIAQALFEGIKAYQASLKSGPNATQQN